jgi:hypothetical protein
MYKEVTKNKEPKNKEPKNKEPNNESIDLLTFD